MHLWFGLQKPNLMVRFGNTFLNQACTHRLHAPGFLKSFLFAHQYVCVCVSVCPSVCPPPWPLITSDMIWCDIGRVWLVKPILQLFSLLPSINWMGVALVTQRVMHATQKCQSWCCTNHGRRRINYLAVATRRSTSVIKVNGRMHSDEFKRRLDFSFTVII